MDIVISTGVLAALITGLALLAAHRQNRKHDDLINKSNKQHDATLLLMKNSLSKDAHVSSHLYTRKAIILEEAYNIIGELHYWAEKCLVPLTSKDFGTTKDKADKMIGKFEEFRLFTFKNSPFIDEKSSLWMEQSNLMTAVNFIHKMSLDESGDSTNQKWIKSVNMLKKELKPASDEIKAEIKQLMNNER